MIIPPTMPPVPVSQAAPSPQVNAAMGSAMVAAQKTARPTETQTRKAPAAVAKVEATREDQSSTFVGYAFDTEAEAVHARTSGERGKRLDVSV